MWKNKADLGNETGLVWGTEKELFLMEMIREGLSEEVTIELRLE